MTPESGRLPRGIALLLLLMERRHREVFAGDLMEEYERFMVPELGDKKARRWLWSQAFRGALVGFLHRTVDLSASVREKFEGGVAGGGGGNMDMLIQDLRYAIRRLIASPGFTLIAVLSLAIGIGANTSIFTIVNAVMMRNSPMEDPASVADLYMYDEKSDIKYDPMSWPTVDDITELTSVFEGVLGWEMFIASTQLESGSEPVMGELVSGNFFSVLGIQPVLGRGFLPEEDMVENRDPVVVISHTYWQNRYAGDRDILGETLKLNGLPFTIVGVAPERLTGMVPGVVSDMWTPSMMVEHLNMFDSGESDPDRASRRFSERSQSVFVKARFRPGVTIEQAEAAMADLARDYRTRLPERWEDVELVAIPTLDVSVHPTADKALAPAATLLMAVVGMLLLIACTNLASFLLARGADRKKEVALRIALGAGRGRLVRQLLTETLLLAGVGGALGIGIAYWTVDFVTRFQPPIAIPITLDLSLDRTVLIFAVLVSLGTGLLFGLLPAMQSTKPDLTSALKDESGGATGGRRRGSLRNLLVMSQVAMSLVLLIGSGLFVRSLISTQNVDPGFNSPEAGMIGLEFGTSGYTSVEARATLKTLQARLLADPAIDQVGMTDRLPLGATIGTNTFEIPGYEDPDNPNGPSIDALRASSEYFGLLGIDILAGRGFGPEDTEGAVNAIIVNEEMARRYWRGESPVGAVLTRGERSFTVVGVARQTKVRTLGEDPRPQIYYSMDQSYAAMVSIIASGPGSADQVVQALHRTVRDFDRDLVIMSESTMTEHLSVVLFAPRVAAVILGISGVLALLLSVVGLYGVVSYSVARRTREMGIRMSLGADGASVRKLVMLGGMRLVGIGTAVGLVLAFAGSQVIGGFLYGVEGTDPLTFLGVPILLATVALVAGFVPAYRASRVDPVRALRHD